MPDKDTAADSRHSTSLMKVERVLAADARRSAKQIDEQQAEMYHCHGNARFR